LIGFVNGLPLVVIERNWQLLAWHW